MLPYMELHEHLHWDSPKQFQDPLPVPLLSRMQFLSANSNNLE